MFLIFSMNFVYRSSGKTKVSYTNWAKNEPSKETSTDDCVEIKNKKWSASKCAKKRQYVCEIPSDEVQAFWDSAPLQDAADSLKAYVFQKFMQTIPERDSDQSTTQVQSSNSNIFSILRFSNVALSFMLK